MRACSGAVQALEQRDHLLQLAHLALVRGGRSLGRVGGPAGVADDQEERDEGDDQHSDVNDRKNHRELHVHLRCDVRHEGTTVSVLGVLLALAVFVPAAVLLGLAAWGIDEYLARTERGPQREPLYRGWDGRQVDA